MSHATEFRSLIVQSRLLSPAELDGWWSQHAYLADAGAEAIADAIVADGLLTHWQARKLLSGKWKGFFIDGYCLTGFVRAGEDVSYFSALEMTAGIKVILGIVPYNRGLRPDGMPRYTVHPAS